MVITFHLSGAERAVLITARRNAGRRCFEEAAARRDGAFRQIAEMIGRDMSHTDMREFEENKTDSWCFGNNSKNINKVRRERGKKGVSWRIVKGEGRRERSN